MSKIIDTMKVEIKKGKTAGISYQVLMGADSGSPQVQMATLFIEPGATLPLHSHPDHEAFFVLEGSGYMTDEGERYPIKAQTVMLAAPGHIHGFTNDGNSALKILCMHPLGAPVTKFVD